MKVISAFGIEVAVDDLSAVMPACACERYSFGYIKPSGIRICEDCGLPKPLLSDIKPTRGGWATRRERLAKKAQT